MQKGQMCVAKMESLLISQEELIKEINQDEEE